MNIQAQYRVFLDRLVEETSSLSLKEVKELELELTRTFMNKPDLYRNIEMVLQAICVGCIKLSVESVAESMISKYNIHNNKFRCISKETAHLEMLEALTEHFMPKDFVTHNALYSDGGKTARRIL
jgi:hypothetical protein